MPTPADDLEVLQYHMYEVARSGGPDENEYKRVRGRILTLPQAPAFLKVCPDYATLRVRFLQVAKGSGSYAQRDAWAKSQLAEVREVAATSHYTDLPATVEDAFADIDSRWVQEHWRDARKFLGDHDGHAVSAARSMLESVCKAILHRYGIPPGKNSNVQILVARTRQRLGLEAGSSLTEMMDGLDATMRAMAKIRGGAGADHGLGPGEEGVEPEVAELFVNTAGAIAVFLRRKADG